VAIATPFVAPFEWRWLALAAATYAVRMFAITAGYHRYFSHRSFRTSRAFQLVLAVLGASAAQKGPLWWAAHHRDHHRFSDGGPARAPRAAGGAEPGAPRPGVARRRRPATILATAPGGD
jgi:fatty-acid desaturase